MRRLRETATIGAMALQGLGVSPAFAAPRQVHFTAPAECPTEQDFRRALDARATRSSVSARAPQQLVVVSIRDTGDGWLGRVEVHSGAAGARVERTTRAHSCDDLVPALALISALALELADASSPDAASPRRDGVDAATTDYPNHLAGAPAPVETAPESLAEAAPRRAAPRLTEGELGFLLHWRSLVGWRDRAAVAPGILWGSRARRGFSPWLRVSGDYVSADFVDAAGRGASLTWSLAQADGCTHKWPLWGAAFISPCVKLSFGALQATGSAGLGAPRELTRLWLSAGAGAEAAIPLVGPLWFRLQAGAEALVLRQRIYADADPDQVLIEMPAAVALLGLGLGVRIW